MRFEVGEMALLVSRYDAWTGLAIGDEVEVMAIGPFPVGSGTIGRAHPAVNIGCLRVSDYEICDSRGYHWHANDCDLRKIYPPIPDSVLSVFTTHKTGEPVDV